MFLNKVESCVQILDEYISDDLCDLVDRDNLLLSSLNPLNYRDGADRDLVNRPGNWWSFKKSQDRYEGDTHQSESKARNNRSWKFDKSLSEQALVVTPLRLE